MLVLVFGGILLFLGTGVGLAIWCFSGTSEALAPREAEGTAESQPPSRQEPAPPNKPEAKEVPLVALPPEDQEKVNQAIDRGVEYLKKSQDPRTGAWPGGRVGYTALPGLTLLECGVPAQDPAVQKAAGHVRSQLTGLTATYDLALAILFLDRLEDPQDKERIWTLALRLVAGQDTAGGWTYDCPVLTPRQQQQLVSVLQANVPPSPLALGPVAFDKLGPAGADALEPAVKNLPVLQPPAGAMRGPRHRIISDNSNTQFAILGLWAARRHGVPLQRTLALIVRRFRNSQNADGAWGYRLWTEWRPSMTCAGLLGMAVGLGLTNEANKMGNKPAEDPTQDPAVQKAVGYLANHVGNPTGRWQGLQLANLYFLWSLERVAVIFRLPKIGEKEWYPWGAEMLVANQQPAGNWQGGGYPGATPLSDTCLALLFLRRANLAKDLTDKLRVGD